MTQGMSESLHRVLLLPEHTHAQEYILFCFAPAS